jgi:hypothetical protein
MLTYHLTINTAETTWAVTVMGFTHSSTVSCYPNPNPNAKSRRSKCRVTCRDLSSLCSCSRSKTIVLMNRFRYMYRPVHYIPHQWTARATVTILFNICKGSETALAERIRLLWILVASGILEVAKWSRFCQGRMRYLWAVLVCVVMCEQYSQGGANRISDGG